MADFFFKQFTETLCIEELEIVPCKEQHMLGCRDQQTEQSNQAKILTTVACEEFEVLLVLKDQLGAVSA